MGKTGRNDPCPCGSGKKYKKCCGKAGSNGKSSMKQAAEATPYLNPSLIAQQWMAAQAQQQEEATSKFKLVLDHFKVHSPEAYDKVRAMGKVDGDTVLFYQKKQWIGEADLSRPKEITLTTADKKTADKLKSQLCAVDGIVHKSRTEDKFEGLEDTGEVDVAAEMKQFKLRFFKVWLDEPNDRLDGKTPREAVEVPALKAKLRKLVAELEEKEQRLSKKERYSFKGIKKELGL